MKDVPEAHSSTHTQMYTTTREWSAQNGMPTTSQMLVQATSSAASQCWNDINI